MSTSTDPVGTDPSNMADHGFFGWWRDARFNYNYENSAGRQPALYEYNLFRKYRDDPMLEQAVWGMRQTPIQGGGVGPGTTGIGK